MELEKVARVLEAAADYLDGVETVKEAAVQAEREKLITAIGEKFAEATGEDISDDVLRKLANADTELLGAFERFAETSTDKIAELGAPGDMNDNTMLTQKERDAAAEDRYLDFLLSP